MSKKNLLEQFYNSMSKEFTKALLNYLFFDNPLALFQNENLTPVEKYQIQRIKIINEITTENQNTESRKQLVDKVEQQIKTDLINRFK